MITKSSKFVFLCLGHFFLIMGIIGVFLPVWPTTPFLLLCAYFYSKGSEKMHSWLLGNKIYGPLIRDWERHGVVRTNAKLAATFGIVLLFSSTLYFVKVSLIIKGILIIIAISVLIFIWTRPSRPQNDYTK